MALGDGINRNKGRRGFAFQEGYRTALDELVKELDRNAGGECTQVERGDITAAVEKLKKSLPL